MPNTEPMHFITSSGIKNIVGQDLITDRFVAIFELVKNAYDAHASEVIVSFDSLDAPPSITIRDNGTGMNKSDLEHKWLHLAYSEKKEGKENNNRAFVGSKGVGRFSCDSLGSVLTIKTKKANEVIENILSVNWQDFEASLSIRFEDISVKYSSRDVATSEIGNSYTELFIENLRHAWDKNSIQKVVESLKRLKNPFDSSDGFDIYCGQNLIATYKVSSGEKCSDVYLVKSDIAEVLKGKSISIDTTVANDVIKVALYDRGQHIYSLEKKNDTIFKNVDIKIVLNYLTTSAKSTFSRRMKIDPVNYGNVFIYKNGFRVAPYGDKDVDLFAINARKAQGYNRYLSMRELIGFIDIKDLNYSFRETSSRNNGFVENVYFESLKEFYMDCAHKLLERYVNLIHWGEIDSEEVTLDSLDLSETEKFSKSLTSKINGGFSLKFFASNFVLPENTPKKQLEKIAPSLPEEQKALIANVIKNVEKLEVDNRGKKHELVAKEKALQVLEKQNKNLMAKRPESSYGEQLGHHLPAMSERLRTAVKELNALGRVIPSDSQKKFFEALRKIRRTELELRSFKNLLLKTELDLRSPQLINWIDIANWCMNDKLQHGLGIKFTSSVINPDAIQKWMIRSNVLEVVMMFENLYQNAQEHGALFLDVQFDIDELRIYSDSTEIELSNLEKIFELGFTTKTNGTGIGLNQVQTFLNKIGFLIRAENVNGLVCFTISKKGE